MSLIEKLRRRWDDWCGDREMEQTIRRHLSENGYYGNTATLSRIRLSAVARPGWVQIYQFNVRARVRIEVGDDEPEPEAVYENLHGVLRDDARERQSSRSTKIRVMRRPEDRDELFDRWSDGLIRTRGAARIRSDDAEMSVASSNDPV